eukprot:NODE_15_length_42055_cov_0.634117.p18 type:complete len:177 gc:universal NODE_15_length_42055_cov_0.634117:27764-28294(+)
MVSEKDYLVDYEEQIYELQRQNKELLEKLRISEVNTRELKDRNDMLQSQISDVEDKFISMREQYDTTITTLKSKMSLSSDATVVQDASVNNIVCGEKSAYKDLYEDSQQEMESIFLSIEKLKESNLRLCEENNELNGILKNQFIRKSIEKMQVDSIFDHDPKKETLFESIKKFLSK